MNPARRTTLVATFLIVLLAAVAGLVRMTAEPATLSPIDHQRQMQQREIQKRFQQAVVMLHAKQFDHAVTALHRVLELAPRLPEAHVNMGYALVGLQKHDAARGFFLAAIELNPRQANAYYGLALADEARGDYETALGGMRTYLHLSRADDAHRARARAAIWEWEEKLGRHRPATGQAAAEPQQPPPARQ